MIYNMRFLKDKTLIHESEIDKHSGVKPYPIICEESEDGIKGSDGKTYKILQVIENPVDLAWFQLWYPAREISRLNLKKTIMESQAVMDKSGNPLDGALARLL